MPSSFMEYSLEQRTASLGVGEFAEFTLGPRDYGDGHSGLWRAQLGTHWHREMRTQTSALHASARFEIPITGKIFHRGWTFTLAGRIDQLVHSENGTVLLREIKTVTRHLPADEVELRREYPSYFIQLAAYVALGRMDPANLTSTPFSALRAELHFVETSSGIAQPIALTASDEALFTAQLERLCEFLNHRLQTRERLRRLQFRPAFATLRPGQHDATAQLAAAAEDHPVLLFEAPTGFGKTGVMLEFALDRLRSGQCERILYLTGKATGQLQVVRTLNEMIAPDPIPRQLLVDTNPEPKNPVQPFPSVSAGSEAAVASIATWHVRNKREHCVNHIFHCTRAACTFLDDLETRWSRSGLARHFLFENHPRDLETLRLAGRDAALCPYEITRAALPFNDVWIGDYNYVFAPSVRRLFFDQPGFDPARTLLIVDEAHNLPSRVADAYSYRFDVTSATAVGEALRHADIAAPLVKAWDHWTHFLQHTKASDQLDPAAEDDARHLLETLASHIVNHPPDSDGLGPSELELLWQIPAVWEDLDHDLPRLWWSPRAGELHLTCLDAARAIGTTLASFGTVVLATATLGPPDHFAAACGLEPPGGLASPAVVRAPTPWRDHAYDVACDLRVDTTYQQRTRHAETTAATIAALHAVARSAIAVFFPSYAYAELIRKTLLEIEPSLRSALQPRQADLAAQSAWIDESLLLSDALFLILGGSFAEGIDALGGRVTHAMVVGPALPEVNAVQRARLDAFSAFGRELAFQRVYQIPGLQKVNQALGRLVRAPGQRAKVLLHCRRFADPAYARLLAPEYQFGANITADEELQAWLNQPKLS